MTTQTENASITIEDEAALLDLPVGTKLLDNEGDVFTKTRPARFTLTRNGQLAGLRAFWSGEEMDDHDKDCAEGSQEHSGAPHLIAAAWHCFTLTQWMHDPELRARFDDRQDDA